MAIITLTTDLGTKDFYQAVLKGTILNQFPEVNLVDITHEIPAFNIPQAAFIVKNAFHYFPKYTVHLIGVDTVYNESGRYVALRYHEHYFVGADNGFFSLVFNEHPNEVVELTILQEAQLLHFPLADILAKAAIHLARGGALKEIGLPITNLLERISLHPVIEQDTIRGCVIYIDAFQNVITNITKSLFTQVQQGRNFTLFFKRNESISQLSWHYNEVLEGENLCLFGMSNHLEIAINKGNASGLLGLKLGDIVRIEFYTAPAII